MKQNRNKLTDIEKKLMAAKGEGSGEMGKVFHIKELTLYLIFSHSFW